MSKVHLGIIGSIIVWCVRGAAMLLALVALMGIGVAVVDPGGGRSGVEARSMVTPEVRFQEGLTWGFVFVVCAIAVWLLTPQRVWGLICRLTTKRGLLNGTARREA
jgi:hypothetical protein